MKTYREFIRETDYKRKKDKPTKTKDGYYIYQAVFGSHSTKERPSPKKGERDSLVVKEGLVPKIKSSLSSENNVGDHNFFSFHQPSVKQIERHETKLDSHASTLDKHYNIDNKMHSGALRAYSTGSKNLNGHLIDHHNDTGTSFMPHKPNEFLHQHVYHLDKALHSHQTPDDMHVYTGVSHSPEHAEVDATTGKRHMHLPAYTSTSLDTRQANGFAKPDPTVMKSKYPGRHVIQVNVPKGSPGAYIEKHSEWKGEHEFLLPRNSKLHINPEPTTHHPLDDDSQAFPTHVWHATLQSHEEH